MFTEITTRLERTDCAMKMIISIAVPLTHVVISLKTGLSSLIVVTVLYASSHTVHALHMEALKSENSLKK